MSDQRTIQALQKLFSNNKYLLDFFLDDCQAKLRFRPDEMRWRVQGQSSGEQVLIRVKKFKAESVIFQMPPKAGHKWT
jgi:hypothetical protein